MENKKEQKTISTVDCMLNIVRACNRIKKNLEFNKVVVNAVNDMHNAVGQLDGVKV